MHMCFPIGKSPTAWWLGALRLNKLCELDADPANTYRLRKNDLKGILFYLSDFYDIYLIC